MNVQLDSNDQRRLEELARSEGKDPGALLLELVHEAIEKRESGGRASEQQSTHVAPADVALSGLAGIGKELWGAEDAQEYVRRVRSEWE